MRQSKMHVYHSEPIDVWCGAIPLRRFLNEFLGPVSPGWDDAVRSEQEIIRTLADLFGPMLALPVWDGTIRNGEEVYVFGLPDPDTGTIRHGLILKDDHGATFTVSPFPLPWLAGDEIHPASFH